MENIYTLSVADISEKLEVHPSTVKKWIASGKLKGEFLNKRNGYRIRIHDFEEFVKRHPEHRPEIRGDLMYEKAKMDIAKDLLIGMYELQKIFLIEEHGNSYSEGWNDAMEKFDRLVKGTLVG